MVEPFDAIKVALEANLHPTTHQESQLDAVLEEGHLTSTAEQLLQFQTPQVSRREENPALVSITPRSVRLIAQTHHITPRLTCHNTLKSDITQPLHGYSKAVSRSQKSVISQV